MATSAHPSVGFGKGGMMNKPPGDGQRATNWQIYFRVPNAGEAPERIQGQWRQDPQQPHGRCGRRSHCDRDGSAALRSGYTRRKPKTWTTEFTGITGAELRFRNVGALGLLAWVAQLRINCETSAGYPDAPPGADGIHRSGSASRCRLPRAGQPRSADRGPVELHLEQAFAPRAPAVARN
jgi:hypothetical protein